MAANGRREDARQQVEPGTARRQRRQEFSGEFRETEEISRSDLWRLILCSIRRQQGACRLSLHESATPTNNPQDADSKNSGTPIYGSRIRVRTRGSQCVQAQPARGQPAGVLLRR